MPQNKSIFANVCNTVTTQAKSIHHSTRIVNNSVSNNGQSTNWKLDFYKFTNLSYAQVVKLPIKKKKTGDYNVTNKIKVCRPPLKVTVAKVGQVITPKSTASCSSTICTSRKPSRRCKVSENNGGIQCYNRFQALQCDDVVSSNVLKTMPLKLVQWSLQGQYMLRNIVQLAMHQLLTLLTK